MSHFKYQPKNILITGGAGFIGANFIRYLLANTQSVKIFNLDLLTYAGALSNLENLIEPSRHTFIHGDIANRDLVEKILQQNDIDTIVHFAAESHVDRSIQEPTAFIFTNVIGTFTLLEAARKHWQHEKKWDETQCRFHHISTDEVFGSLTADEPPFSEQSRYAPNSPYSASKAGSDHLVRAYFHTYNLPITISNCSNNYGPYQYTEKLIPTIIRACKNRHRIPIYGDGTNIRDWLYVEDHCSAIYTILRQGKIGETYNVGGNNELNNITVAKHICNLMDEIFSPQETYHSLIYFVEDRQGHDWRYSVNNTKIFYELGWQPKQDFATGTRQTIQFYCA